MATQAQGIADIAEHDLRRGEAPVEPTVRQEPHPPFPSIGLGDINESMQPNQTEPTDLVIHCDLELARQLERAEGRSNAEFVDARTKALPETRGEWIEVAGAYAMFDGVDSPCTQTFGLGLFDSVTDANMEKLEQFFQRRGSDVFHEVSPLAEASLLRLLGERGYRPMELSSVLFRQIHAGLQLASSRDDSIQVRQIESGEEDLWARTAASGWADTAPGLEDYLLQLGKVNAHRQDTHCFLAQKQGTTIAAAAVCLPAAVAVLAGACTVPKWRKQGAQLALLEFRLRFAAEHGCNIAMVVTQPGSASQRNAERQGFHVAYTRIKWQLGFERADTDASVV